MTRTTDARVSRPLAIGLLVAAAALFVSVMTTVASTGPGYDLVPLAVAGRLTADGQSSALYAQDPVHYNHVSNPIVAQAAARAGFPSEPTPFVYPPLVAYAMQGLAGVRFAAIARAWAWLSVLLLLAGLHLVSATYLPGATFWRRPLAWAAVLVALCVFEPIRYGFWLGQTTASIFPLVAAALLLQRRGRPAAAGGALALAAFVKLTPIVFALVWLWRGPRRAVAWCLGWLALLWTISVAAMGTATHAAYLARVAAIGRIDVVAYNNHSLLAFVSRGWLDRSTWASWQMWTAPRPAFFLAWTVIATGAVVLLALLARIPRGADAAWRPLAEASACLALLLVPNIAWTHYFVFLLPVFAALVAVSAARGRRVAVSVSIVVAFALCSRGVLAAQHEIPSTDSLLRISAPAIAALVAAAAVCWSAWESA